MYNQMKYGLIRTFDRNVNGFFMFFALFSVVREVLQGCGTDLRVQSVTLECLQEATESYMVQLFEDCYLCCLHRARVTLTDKDVRLVQILRGPSEVGRS